MKSATVGRGTVRGVVLGVALGAAIAVGTSLAVSSASQADSTVARKSPSEEKLLTGTEMSELLRAETESLVSNGKNLTVATPKLRTGRQELFYPSAELRDETLDRLSQMTFDEEARWESGVPEMMIIDAWECSWLEFASDAAQQDDPKKVILAGENLLKMKQLPAVEENFPDVDLYLAEIVAPLLKGDGSNIVEFTQTQCGGQ